MAVGGRCPIITIAFYISLYPNVAIDWQNSIVYIQPNLNTIFSIWFLEKVLERGERLDILVDKTEELNKSVSTYSILSTFYTKSFVSVFIGF